MGHGIREQRIRQRVNGFREAQALRSVTDACVIFGISRKPYDTAALLLDLAGPDQGRTPCANRRLPPD